MNDWIGYIGCVFLFISFIPQTYKLIQNKDEILNISPYFIVFIVLASIFMGSYAILIKAYPVLIANGSVLINNLIILSFLIYKKSILSC